MGLPKRQNGSHFQPLHPEQKLKLWVPGDYSAPDPNGPLLSPETRLSQFFEQWYLPVCLQGESASPATIGLYRDALARWKECTGDPPVRMIDELLVSKFQQQLRACTYRRGPSGILRPLSASTISRHLRNLRALLYRIGPKTDPKRFAKGLIAEAPHITVRNPHTAVKPAFAMPIAKRIAAACDDMTGPEVAGIPPRLWWRLWVAMNFYTGCRSGTVMKFTRSLLRESSEGLWMDVTAEIVPKTEKATSVLLHSQAVECIAAVLPLLGDRQALLPFPHHKRHLQTMHEELQQRAGIFEAHWLSPQAWRRTHGQEMARLGYRHAVEIARQSLDHADSATTEAHYVEIKNELRLKLEPLWPKKAKGDDPRQQKLF